MGIIFELEKIKSLKEMSEFIKKNKIKEIQILNDNFDVIYSFTNFNKDKGFFNCDLEENAYKLGMKFIRNSYLSNLRDCIKEHGILLCWNECE